jgi:hypothetical protein
MVKRSDEALWERIKSEVTREETAGTAAGAWSARKAQLAVRRYKAAGGKYIGPKKPTSLSRWTEQDWTTKSGKPSSETGERYLPRKAIDAMSDRMYKETTAKKRADTKKGEQFSRQPQSVAEFVKRYREYN